MDGILIVGQAKRKKQAEQFPTKLDRTNFYEFFFQSADGEKMIFFSGDLPIRSKHDFWLWAFNVDWLLIWLEASAIIDRAYYDVVSALCTYIRREHANESIARSQSSRFVSIQKHVHAFVNQINVCKATNKEKASLLL